jgi:hypothetical protein
MLSQTDLITALVRETERQLPGIVVTMPAMHSLVTAVHFIFEKLEQQQMEQPQPQTPMKGSFTPVIQDE